MAQFSQSHVVVYQAYRPEIGRYAVEHQRFGGPFNMGRMSWIKPNFLWMMFRSGWGTKPDQEVTLAVTLQRAAFDSILAQAVHSTFVRDIYATEAAWRSALASSSVRLQWDPDHGPRGEPLDRRAVQLGLRGETLARYASEWIVSIEDISTFVAEQRRILVNDGATAILTPVEHPYPVADDAVASRLDVQTFPP